jgi:hypothetical protein
LVFSAALVSGLVSGSVEALASVEVWGSAEVEVEVEAVGWAVEGGPRT